MAAVLPAVVIAVGLVFFFSVLGFPVLGFFAGAALGVLVVLSEVGLLIGALLGGFIRAKRYQ